MLLSLRGLADRAIRLRLRDLRRNIGQIKIFIMATTADIKIGMCIELDGKTFQIVDFQHV